MIHIKKFNESNNNMKEEVEKYISDNYSEDQVLQMLDDEITSGDWLEEDWEDEFDNEFDAYEEYSRGEAEAAVRMQIESDVMKKFDITHDDYFKKTGEHLWETILEMFPDLDK